MQETNDRKRQTLIRTILVIVLILALLAIGYCVWYLIQYQKGAQLGSDLQTIGVIGDDVIDESAPELQEFVEIPIDFEALWDVNPDIYAWIVVPNTNISYPVTQSTDNDYYLNHTFDGDDNTGGTTPQTPSGELEG